MLVWPAREPSRFAAGGRFKTLEIHRLISLPFVLRTETVRAPLKCPYFCGTGNFCCIRCWISDHGWQSIPFVPAAMPLA